MAGAYPHRRGNERSNMASKGTEPQEGRQAHNPLMEYDPKKNVRPEWVDKIKIPRYKPYVLGSPRDNGKGKGNGKND